jgi:hypothetical protein
MAGGGTNRSHFAGVEMLAPPEAIDAWLRSASAGDEYVYCEARDPLRGEGWIRMRDLAGDGLVRTHERRRQGGGKQFYAVRTGKGLPRRRDPQEEALGDRATDLIFRALKRAANFTAACPSDTDLAETAGLSSRNASAWRMRKLIDVGLIGSTVEYRGGVPFRVVTVLAGRFAGTAAGKSTAMPNQVRRGAVEAQGLAADRRDLKRLREAGL